MNPKDYIHNQIRFLDAYGYTNNKIERTMRREIIPSFVRTYKKALKNELKKELTRRRQRGEIPPDLKKKIIDAHKLRALPVVLPAFFDDSDQENFDTEAKNEYDKVIDEWKRRTSK